MFVEQLQTVYQRAYGDVNSDFGCIVTWCGRLVLENISNSDARIRLRYLRLTEDDKQWVANMHSHVFDSEHDTRT
jgi:hypothetical protein